MENAKNILAIFVKYPQAGFVKTRLAKDIGPKAATFLYKNFVNITIKRSASKKYKTIIFYTPAKQSKRMVDWLGGDFEYVVQCGNDLGKRMQNAFKFIFSRGAKKAVIVGTDSPFIEESEILKSFKRLDKIDCVIGPSYDGGYYLLGMNKPCKKIFDNIEWSTETVLKQTIDILKEKDISYSFIDTGFDIDNLDDLFLFKRILAQSTRQERKVFFPVIEELEKIK